MLNRVRSFFTSRPQLMAVVTKIMRDNVGMLASVVAWTLFTSVVPIVVGLVAISGLLLRDPGAQRAVVSHLSGALQGVLTQTDITAFVHATVTHNGLLGLIGFVGVFWGGSNVGGAISTVFQPIFQVRGRDYLQEKLIDVAMIFVFTALMIVIVGSTTAVALIDRLFTSIQVPGIAAFGLGTLVSLLAAFLLFAIIYLVFPNVDPRFKMRNIWDGSLLAAVLFQLVTYIWPLYARVVHLQRYGAVLAAIVVLTAWIYFLALILIIGAEVVSIRALRDARAAGRPVGPQPDGTVPQRMDDSTDLASGL